MDQKAIEEILQQEGFENLKRSQSPILKHRGLDFGFTFDLLIGGIVFKMTIGFPNQFPLILPQYFIAEDNGNIPFIPHVEEDGRICYYQDDYLLIDVERVPDILKETLNKTKEIVEKGLTKENFYDFTSEFEAYWNRLQNLEFASFNGSVDDNACIIKVGTRGATKYIVSEQNEYLNSAARFFSIKEGGFTFNNAIHIPINGSQIIVPPRYNLGLTIDYLRNLIRDYVDPQVTQSANKLISRASKAEEYVIFSIKRTDGSSSLFGVKFTGMNKIIHPLLQDDFKGKIIPVRITRIDKNYLFRRGSNGISQNKKGLLIGGGSIGGFISEDIIRSGFFNLTIVDAEKISADNCYRHVLGFNSIEQNKAIALKNYLEQKFPHCTVKAQNANIEQLIAKNKISLADYDFIIVATGNVTINIYLNNLIKSRKLKMPVFYVWNDPYGIGGHCLITNLVGFGCYECLYTNETRTNAASFAHRQQEKSFLKNASGCGSYFTPYGATDSIQTSLLAIRKLLTIFSGAELENAIYSWKGCPDIFIEEGYKLSARFNMNDQELEESKNKFINSHCQTCNSKQQ